MRPAGALALALAVFASAGATRAQPRSISAAAVAELRLCLQGQRWSLDERHLAVAEGEASGLPTEMQSARVPSSSGRLVVYEDDGRGSVIECGVAVYTAVSSDIGPALKQVVEEVKPGLRPASPDFWRLKGAPGELTYWGDSGAPGLYGVLMRQGAADGDAPFIQVDSHSILVH